MVEELINIKELVEEGISSNLKSLDTLVTEYPWFSVGHISRAQAYFSEVHKDFSDVLSKTAVYVGNPAILFDMFKENPSEETLDIAKSEPDLSGPEEKGAPEFGEEVEQPNPDPLEKEIIVEAISRTIEKEVSEEALLVVEEDSERDLVADELANNLSAFSAYLYQKSKEIGFSQPQVVELEKSSEEKVKSIIDKFIQDRPQISRGKAHEYSTEDLAKKSLIEDERLVTETMAKIYASQGKMDKAKRSYRLLSLKYPEKSVYFAAQLKKLGKKTK